MQFDRENFFYLEEPSGKWHLSVGEIQESSPSPIQFGALSFYPKDYSKNLETKINPWKNWPHEFWFSPREYRSGGSSEEVLENFFPAIYSPPTFKISEIKNPSARIEWNNLFSQTMNALTDENNELKKIVLARLKEFTLEKEYKTSELLLKFLTTKFLNAYKFFIHYNGEVFLGASPEILFSQSKNKIYTAAVAGTVKKNKHLAEDIDQYDALIRSPKNLTEHQYVVDFITKQLECLKGKLLYSQTPDLLNSKNLIHLITPITFESEASIQAVTLLKKLHPTPALSGLPQKDALDFLAQKEPFHRGFYASPLGFYTPQTQEAKFIIGIRSILISKKSLYCFAGAGIVEKSNEEEEWLEIEEKMQTILSLFQCE